MKTGADVLNEILNELNLRAPTLAKNIGLPHYRLSDIQTGRVKKISGEMAHAINKRYPQYSIEYLLTGEGNTASNEVNGSNNVIGNHNKVGHDDVINKLIDELSAMRKQNDRLLSIIEEQTRVITAINK